VRGEVAVPAEATTTSGGPKACSASSKSRSMSGTVETSACTARDVPPAASIAATTSAAAAALPT
jgi:hypothetical protein